MEKQKSNEPIFEVKLRVTEKHNRPAIEIRTLTTDPEVIRTLVMCAYRRNPVVLLPTFSNTMRSMAALVEKGVLYQKDNKYYFV